LLEKIAVDTLELCEQYKCKSLAIPPLGTGIAGVPIGKCAKAFVNSFVSYLEKNKKTKIEKIGIIIYDDKTLAEFKKFVETIDLSKYEEEKKDDSSKKSKPIPSSSDSDSDKVPKKQLPPKGQGKKDDK
jgi:hypothetical protein